MVSFAAHHFFTNLQNSNLNLYQSVLNSHWINFQLRPCRQTLPASQIELPAVPLTFDYMTTEPSFCERRPFVRAKILGGTEFAIYVEKSQLATVRQLDAGGTAQPKFFRATNGNSFACAARFTEVVGISTE